LAAILVRAVLAHPKSRSDRALCALTANYLKSPRVGPLDIDVHVLRSGRRVVRSAITARQDGEIMVTGTATMSATNLPETDEWCPVPVDAGEPPPARAREVAADRYCPSEGHWLRPPAELPPVIHRAKLAPRFGSGRFSGFRAVDGAAPATGGWITLREPQRIDPAYVALCADIWWPASLEPFSRPTQAPTLELAIHFRAQLPEHGLPAAPVLGHFRATAAIGGLVDEDGALFLADGTLLAQSRQLSMLLPID
jgi:acyl-CoA thioesterase